MSGYGLHSKAFVDLEEVRSFIAAENPDAADRLITEIFSAIRMLAQFPYSGHARPDLTSRPLRFILVKKYLIAYAPENQPVWIIAVIDGRRSPHLIASILKSRK